MSNPVPTHPRNVSTSTVDNITDEEVISNATYIADIVDSTITGNMAPPRTYGAQFKVQF